MKSLLAVSCLISCGLLVISGCNTTTKKTCSHQRVKYNVEEVAKSQRQWTGVAVSKQGRMFVNFPRWSADVPVSVAEISQAGMKEYPNQTWNQWSADMDPRQHWVCVQSVYVDDQDYLWVLDAASPSMDGAIAGGPKLVKIDLSKNEPIQTIYFDANTAPQTSYLNDVRVDTGKQYAYITDSGTGSIIVVNLASGQYKKVLSTHPSTKSENIVINIDGKPWMRNGVLPQIHADGIALDPTREYLYYHALTADTLYRVPTSMLRDFTMSDEQIARRIDIVGRTGPCDGMIFGNDGALYLTYFPEHAIQRLPNGRPEVVAKDDRLQWPDSFAVGPEGTIYVTTSQINLGPKPSQDYKIFKLVKARR